LKSLRDEVGSGHAASPGTLLCHAMRIDPGDRPPEPEGQAAWAESGVVRPGLTVYPIPRRGGRGLDQCYFGHADAGTIARFEDQAKGLFYTALEALQHVGPGYGRPPFGVDGWVYLCYCMAWDYPDRVEYKILDDSVGVSAPYAPRGPFLDRGAFTSWWRGSAAFGEGTFFARLSRDVRSCSVSAVGAILSLAAEPEAAAEPRRRSDPELEARNQWIYDRCRDGTPRKQVVAELAKRQDLGGAVSIQRVGQILKEHAARHDLPPVQAHCGRRPGRGAGEAGRV
jgi:hypothetical protein